MIAYTGSKSPLISDVLVPAGVSPAVILEVRITEAIIELSQAGRGIAVRAGWVFDDLPVSSGLRAVRIGRYGSKREWLAVVGAHCTDKQALNLVQAVKAVAAKMREGNWRGILSESV